MAIIVETTDHSNIRLDDPDRLKIRLCAYLSRQLDRDVRIDKLHRFAVGFSWITFGFRLPAPGIDGCIELILRLGPAYGLFAPYSAAPQHLALVALDGSAVPAPRSFYWSDDPEFLGAPFFISEKAAGVARAPWGATSFINEDHRVSLGRAFTGALAALHTITWQNTALVRFGADVTPQNAALQQIEVWEGNYQRWALKPYPMMQVAVQWLRDNQPSAPRVSIVHGDYRLGNFLELDGRITAVLDWELVHLGDPHEDLAWFCLPQYRGGTDLMSRLIPRDEFYRRYTAASGVAVDVNSMRFYEIFSLVKLAATHMAATASFERGGFHDMRMPAMGTQISPVLRQIEKILEAGR